jgi:hypothetical protein
MHASKSAGRRDPLGPASEIVYRATDPEITLGGEIGLRIPSNFFF